jgi:hypothetical protein
VWLELHRDRVRHRDRDWFRVRDWYRDVLPNWVGDRDRDGLGDPDGSYRQREPNGVCGLFRPAEVDGLDVVGITLKLSV